MKKMIVCILIIMLILSGCSPKDNSSDSLRNEIQEAYKQQFLSPAQRRDHEFTTDDDDTIAGMQYYGTYNGYTILFLEGMLAVVSEFQIGDYSFKWGSYCTLYAYKDGEFYKLSEVYKEGNLTDSDIEDIAIKHKAYFSTRHAWDYDINELSKPTESTTAP